jgi:hypothetical protein
MGVDSVFEDSRLGHAQAGVILKRSDKYTGEGEAVGVSFMSPLSSVELI